MRFSDKIYLLLLGTFGFSTFTGTAQDALNMTEIGHLTYNQELSEVRGALHNGREYALVGVYDGLSIVDVTDPAIPTQVFFESGPGSIWRDPFYHNGHAYCVTEGGGGLLIVDMTPLPVSTNLTTTLYTGGTHSFSSAHNMFIDSDNEKAYIFGTNTVDGAIILDISDPMAPTEVGIWNEYYIHDGFVRGDTLWAACLEAGAFVVDVSVPSNPVVLANWDTPSEFAHNIWPSDDNAFCYTTDEVNSGFIAIYDMSDYQNVVETDKDNHPLSEGVIPHNSHFMNDFVITSHYRDGVSVYDVSDPNNMVLTGYFDSSPMSGGGFNGSWGTWPYLPSGNVLVSDIEEGLFVLGATYVQAARLAGTVTEFGSGNPLNGVQIEILSTSIAESTDLFGDYATGMEAAGTYSVSFQKGGYLPQTITGVTLQNGQTITLDVELVPDVAFSIVGTVTEAGTGTPIEGATVQLVSEFFDLMYDTDAQGQYSESQFFGGTYEVMVGAWGYIGQCAEVTIDQAGSLDFVLDPGYADDFALDLGWTISGNATTGVWVRDYPVGTDYNGMQANPAADAAGDCSGQAFVTGNAVGAVNIDDVDDGATILTSPSMDLTTYGTPVIQFDYWFFNEGGSSTPNDELILKVDNGIDVEIIESLSTTPEQWTNYSFSVGDFITVTNDMKVVLQITDAVPGHLVEGGIDRFSVMNASSIDDSADDPDISIYPNPTDQGYINVVLGPNTRQASLKMFDAAGKCVSKDVQLYSGVNKVNIPSSKGFYLMETQIDGTRDVQRLLVQ